MALTDTEAATRLPRHSQRDTDPLDVLADQIAQVVKDSLPVLTLQAARTMCNEAGLRRYQQEQESLLEQYATTQDLKRAAKHRLDVATEAHRDALGEATWTIGTVSFDTRSNKTWLVVGDDGKPIPEDQQRSVTADEKKDWLARNAAKHPAVIEAAAAVRKAEADLAEANDHLGLIDRSLTAVKHALDAARVDLQTLAMSLTARKDTNA